MQYGINRPKQLKTNAHVVIQIMHPINPCQKVVTYNALARQAAGFFCPVCPGAFDSAPRSSRVIPKPPSLEWASQQHVSSRSICSNLLATWCLQISCQIGLMPCYFRHFLSSCRHFRIPSVILAVKSNPPGPVTCYSACKLKRRRRGQDVPKSIWRFCGMPAAPTGWGWGSRA